MGGWKVTVDHWYEMLLVGAVLLACVVALVTGVKALVGMVLGFLGRGGKLKAGPLEAGGVKTECAPYVEQHSEMLNRLAANVMELTGIAKAQALETRALYQMQGPQLKAMAALLESVKGITNGNVDEAIRHVRESQKTFEDTLMGKIGAA